MNNSDPDASLPLPQKPRGQIRAALISGRYVVGPNRAVPKARFGPSVPLPVREKASKAKEMGLVCAGILREGEVQGRGEESLAF